MTIIQIRTIIQRLRATQAQRQIQRELGIHRTLIRAVQTVAISQNWLEANSPMPSDEEIASKWKRKAEQRCHILDEYKTQLEAWHKEGYSSIVIQQLLKEKCPCDLQAIRRYRKKHFPRYIEPVMVRETVPGRDMELDFGELGRFQDCEGNLKKVWLFSLRLRHSRRAYREIVLNQAIPTFLKGHINAFEYFQGVPGYCIPDNLKAAVTRSTVDNDMINRNYQSLAEHYGFIISPCLPCRPAHKGGVEGDVKYSKRNFLPVFLEQQRQMGIENPSIEDLKSALDKWSREIADLHVIGGLGRTPLDIFISEEKAALRPLPTIRWEQISWKQCHVRRDWRIMLGSAYYSVPYQLIGQTVDVCITDSLIRICHNNSEVAVHEKATKQWDYKRKNEHAPPFKEAVLQCSKEGLFELAHAIGPSTYKMVEQILSHPTVDKLRPARCLLKLTEKYSKEDLELACQRAIACQLFSYNGVKTILEKSLQYESLENPTKKEDVVIELHRFSRNPLEYECVKTFEDRLEEAYPFSRFGNAMRGVCNAQMGDQIMEEFFAESKASTNSQRATNTINNNGAA